MNSFLAHRTIKYFLSSKHKNGHGIHSPFVYSIITEVLKNKADSSIVNRVKKARVRHLSDNRVIDVNDLGSGSLKIKSNRRRVSEIARYASVRPKYGKLLSKFAAQLDGSTIIELGTSLGIGTMYLALGAPNSNVITIEGCENTATIASETFHRENLNNIKVLKDDFDDILNEVLMSSGKIGMIYIDGNHKSIPLLRYMKSIIKFVDKDTLLVVDDIHYSEDMEYAWNKLKEWSEVTISIDILQMGLLFFKSGIRKQNFMIRY